MVMKVSGNSENNANPVISKIYQIQSDAGSLKLKALSTIPKSEIDKAVLALQSSASELCKLSPEYETSKMKFTLILVIENNKPIYAIKAEYESLNVQKQKDFTEKINGIFYPCLNLKDKAGNKVLPRETETIVMIPPSRAKAQETSSEIHFSGFGVDDFDHGEKAKKGGKGAFEVSIVPEVKKEKAEKFRAEVSKELNGLFSKNSETENKAKEKVKKAPQGSNRRINPEDFKDLKSSPSLESIFVFPQIPKQLSDKMQPPPNLDKVFPNKPKGNDFAEQTETE